MSQMHIQLTAVTKQVQCAFYFYKLTCLLANKWLI